MRPRTAGGFEIVAGERRYRAALRAGLTQVPVVVRSLTDAETLALALIENLMREDIGPLETARAYRRLMDDFGLTQEEVGQRVGKSRSAVGNTVRLMDLPPVIQESLEKGEITEGHARTLLSEEKRHALPDFKARQLKVWRMIREKGLTVREVERLMRSAAETAPPAARRTSADLAAVQDRFRTALGYKVRIDGSEAQGKIVIDYYSADELEGILARIEGAAEEPTTPHRPTRGSGPIPGLLSSRRPSD